MTKSKTKDEIIARMHEVLRDPKKFNKISKDMDVPANEMDEEMIQLFDELAVLKGDKDGFQRN